jgi:hypothetical protein
MLWVDETRGEFGMDFAVLLCESRCDHGALYKLLLLLLLLLLLMSMCTRCAGCEPVGSLVQQCVRAGAC